MIANVRPGSADVDPVEYIMDTEADVVALPAGAPAGAVAYTADGAAEYRMSPSGVWTKRVGG